MGTCTRCCRRHFGDGVCERRVFGPPGTDAAICFARGWKGGARRLDGASNVCEGCRYERKRLRVGSRGGLSTLQIWADCSSYQMSEAVGRAHNGFESQMHSFAHPKHFRDGMYTARARVCIPFGSPRISTDKPR